MKALKYSSICLLVLCSCNATTDVLTPLDSKQEDSKSSSLDESSRKTVRATSGTADPGSNNIPFHLNSLSSNQDGQSKQPHSPINSNSHVGLSSHIAHPNGNSAPPPNSHHQLQQYVRAFATLPKDTNFPPQPMLHQSVSLGQKSPVLQLPPGAAGGTGGYILSVNTETGQTVISSGPTPVIMQYLPQSQSSSGIQYLQLMPTRPLIVPISPFLPQIQHQAQPPTQYRQSLQTHHQPQLHQQQPSQLHQPQQPQQQLYQPATNSGPYQLSQAQPTHFLSATRPSSGLPSPAPYPYANYAAAQSYLTAGQKLQFHQPLSPSTAQYPIYHSPQTSGGGSYAAASSSAPVLSMFRPNTGIQLINGPLDMSLNTNEYLPAQSENGYKMRRA